MGKIRVYELARELNIESKILLNTMKNMGIVVASHQSMLSEVDAEKIREFVSGKGTSTNVEASTAKEPVKVIRRRVVRNTDSSSVTVTRTVAGTDKKETTPKEDHPVDSTNSVSSEAEKVTDTKVEEPVKKGLADRIKSFFTSSKESKETQEKQPESASVQIEAEAVSQETTTTATLSTEVSGQEVSVKDEPSKQEIKEVPEKKVVKKEKPRVGATIVRKATPEEVAAASKNREYQRGSSRIRREDTKGTHFTGIGSGTQAGYQDMPQSSSNQWKKDKDKKKQDDDGEDYIKKPSMFKTGKKEVFNARSLLSQLDEDYDEDDPLMDDRLVSKLVYTPSAAFKKKALKRRTDLKKTNITVSKAQYRIIKMAETISVATLAKDLKVKASEIIKKLMAQGVMVSVNESIDFDTASLIASEYNYEVQSSVLAEDDVLKNLYPKDPVYETRPPIVTVMGHVDHGKTSILDAIRKTSVASGEAGGITQHIGAYFIDYNGHRISFIDTPGHEAFSSMRARGANVTDIVVLVVAADDGVMPQTVEAISHAKDAGVPIIVAVNKIDKDHINIDRIYTQLSEYGITSEEWGGENQFVKVSALKGIGLDELLDAILLQAEILELKACKDYPARGVVLEANLDTGRGAVATVIVQNGTLRVGDYVLVGHEMGKVRMMNDFLGRSLTEAPPSTPVALVGLSSPPNAGDIFYKVEDEKQARELLDVIIAKEEKAKVKQSASQGLEDLLSKMKDMDSCELPIIIKADTQGSAEALSDSIVKLSTDQIKNKIIHKGVGGISESDLALAQTSKAVIIGFNVRSVSKSIDDEADEQGIVIKYFSVIYDVVDAIKSIMVGKLPPILEEEVIGHAEVKEAINVSKIGTIAGSTVIDGKVTRNANVRLIRDSIVIYNGKIGSLRRFKDDVKEVKSGYECGISIENYNDIKIGDTLEIFVINEVAPTL